MVAGSRYEKGTPADFDREFALDREKFWHFLETTQPEELEKLSDRPNWQRLILERLDRKIKKDGIFSVLKKGLSIDDAHLTLLYSLEDLQDKILKAMEGRKLGKNASYFAFTATPKNSTLEKFGQRTTADGKFAPFHLYSMKQAIEEGFILDVLANYTTYRSYYEIQKSIQDNPLFDTAKAQKKLRAFVKGHKETIATKADIKADIMVSHFIEQVWKPKKLKGHANVNLIDAGDEIEDVADEFDCTPEQVRAAIQFEAQNCAA